MIPPELTSVAHRIADLLRERRETVGVAEGSAGGLVSAALLAVPGASVYYRGGVVVYTPAAYRAFVAGVVEAPPGMRGATEAFAAHLATSVRLQLGATWGVAEAGAAGPPNPYGDPAGHCWIAVDGPQAATRRLSTGVDEREANMVAFARSTLEMFAGVLADGGPGTNG